MKYLKTLLLLLSLTLCVACNKKVEPFDLKDEYYEESKLEEIDKDRLEELIDDKESMGVFVYLPGCSSCAEFKVVLEDFQKENTVTFYMIQIKDIHAMGLNDKIKYAPSFLIYKEGELVSYLDAESDKDLKYYQSVDGFKEWLTKYINLK